MDFPASRKAQIGSASVINRKSHDKFNEYAINTDDAWEIDDRTMSLKILDPENSNGEESNDQPSTLSISKQVRFLRDRIQ